MLAPRHPDYANLPLSGMAGEPPCAEGWRWDGGDSHFWMPRSEWIDAFGALGAYAPGEMLDSEYNADVEYANPIRRMEEGSAQCLGCYAVRAPDGEVTFWVDCVPQMLTPEDTPEEIVNCALPGWRDAVSSLWGDPDRDEEMTAILKREAERLGLEIRDDLNMLTLGDREYDPRVFVEWQPGDLAARM